MRPSTAPRTPTRPPRPSAPPALRAPGSPPDVPATPPEGGAKARGAALGREWIQGLLKKFGPLREKASNVTVLDFEKPLVELDQRINEVRKVAEENGVDVSGQIRELEERATSLRSETYSRLTPTQRLQARREGERGRERERRGRERAAETTVGPSGAPRGGAAVGVWPAPLLAVGSALSVPSHPPPPSPPFFPWPRARPAVSGCARSRRLRPADDPVSASLERGARRDICASACDVPRACLWAGDYSIAPHISPRLCTATSYLLAPFLLPLPFPPAPTPHPHPHPP